MNANGAILLTIQTLTLTMLASSAFSADKNGVSPMAISRPSGPGSLEGLGDSFQPSLNTGTAKYSVPIALPPGIAGHSPMLSLQYDSGRGCGIPGMGWSVEIWSIRRQTDEGQPRYFDLPSGTEPLDRFLGVTEEEIVPLVNGYFLSKTEGMFLRYRRVGDGWEAHSKSGVKYEFGLGDESRVSDPTGKKNYKWWIERQTDTNGNVIEYGYERVDPASRQVYPTEIRYGPGAPPWDHSYSVRMSYEERPDHWTDYRAGFRVATTRRLKQIDVLYDDQLIRRYVLAFEADPNQSLLTSITQFGADGTSTLPRTTFSYATFPMGNPGVPIDANGLAIGSIGEPGAVMDSSARLELIDLNSDGLPDLLNTDAIHRAYLNGGVENAEGGRRIRWEGPEVVTIEDGRVLDFQLSDFKVHLADMTGDGIADWIVTGTDGVDCFANTGRVGWATQRRVAVQKFPPPAPYASPDRSVLSTDLDFDKRMDVIKSEDGAYSIWINQRNGSFSDRVLTPGARFKGKFLHFAFAGVQLADMNGDRLNDVVEVGSHSVVYCPTMGFGLFDECVEIPLPIQDPTLEPEQVVRAKVIDINGDGLADLVVERFNGSDLRFWIHLPNDTFARSRLITGLPATPNAVTRWADMNGNGTVDLLYADSSLQESRLNTVDIGLLVAGSSHYNALTAIDNGYGRRTDIVYRATTDYYLDSRAAGNPWLVTLPFPTSVVSQTRVSIGLNLDGFADEGPRGDVYLTDFVYRDGYYDRLREQFRGFAFVKQISRGDERFGGSSAPTLVSRHYFHTGAPDGVDNDGNGETDEAGEWKGREEEPLKGAELWRETTSLPDDSSRDGMFANDPVIFERVQNTYIVRELCTDDGGALPAVLGDGYRANDPYERTVRFLVPRLSRRSVIERASGPAKIIETRTDLDPFGNTILDENLGELSSPTDNIRTETEYALNEPAWIVDRVARTVQRDGTTGAVVSDVRQYYDGDPFVGLPLGQVGARGLMHRKEAMVSFGVVPELTQRSFAVGDPRDLEGRVDALRQRFDDYGNVVESLDAEARLNPQGQPLGTGHERRIEFDAQLQKYPVRETVIVAANKPGLSVVAAHDPRFDSTLFVSDYSGNITNFVYDAFGRMTGEIRSGDDPGRPTLEYSYDLGSPISRIMTTQHTGEGGSNDVRSVRFMDGLGRKLAIVELGGPVVKEATLYDTRGNVRMEFEPYAGGGESWTPPGAGSAARSYAFDATGRRIRSESPPDEFGVSAVQTVEFAPLIQRQFDGEDNRPGSPHAGTPKTLVSDGLGRLIEVRLEEQIAAQSGTFTTRYRYAVPDRLTEIEDANGNIRYMRSDGLGRKIFMNDPDRGPMTYTYDAVGNLLETVDARGQRIRWTYDGGNRPLTEDFEDEGAAHSPEQNPDVQYHYDDPHPDYPWLRNTPGKLAWISDLTGSEALGYDTRGEIENVVKSIDQIGGGTRTYLTSTLSDSMRRVYQITYLDGGAVTYRYDARGLLAEVSDFVEQISYAPSADQDEIRFSNGVNTGFDYDPRFRLSRLRATNSEGAIQDLAYQYDQADNILNITDLRGLPANDPRSQTRVHQFDDCYRLRMALQPGLGPPMSFEYDPIHNMIFKAVPTAWGHPEENLGSISHGGPAGTSNRVGKSPGAPPGPHAVTSAGSLPGVTMQYDENGNWIADDQAEYSYDFRDRLVGVEGDSGSTEYRYDYSNRRVYKRVNGVQTTYVSRLTEIRGDRPFNYVFAGETRCARTDGAIPTPDIVAQRIPLFKGWNLISFQVSSPSTAIGTILDDILEDVVVVAELKNGAYLLYQPGIPNPPLSQMHPNHGYWVRVIRDTELRIAGPIATQSVPVSPPGESLIGAPGMASRPIDSLLSGAPADYSVWRYKGDTGGWSVAGPGVPETARNLSSTRPGEAYWIRPSAATSTTFQPPTPPSIHWYVPDHLGSTNLLTDADGAVTSETNYFPFGGIRNSTESKDEEDANRYDFSGKERDVETGLLYFDARYVSPRFGRFITVDPLLGETPSKDGDGEGAENWLSDPLNFNLYAYSQNNPLSKVDPSGTETVYLINKAKTVITVRTTIVIYGPKASHAVAKQIKSSIQNKWNKGLTYDGKKVRFEVQIMHQKMSDAAAANIRGKKGIADLIYIGDDGRSEVTKTNEYKDAKGNVTSRVAYGKWFTSWTTGGLATGEISRVAPHEYVHQNSLPDQYTNNPVPPGAKASTTPNPGWAGNIQAETSGSVDQRNVDAILKDVKLKEK